MAKSGQVTLRGRFSKGSVVTLTKVAGEHVLRPQGGEEIATKTVGDEDGVSFVQFTSGVEVGERYFIHGINDGHPLQIRVTGKPKDADSEVLAQAPVQSDRVRLADGTWSDERPKRRENPALASTFPGQDQVPQGTVQRSDTFRGSAHPVDPEREEPIRRQESVPDGTVQMSDTRPREVDGVQVGGGGEASELVLGPQRQEDVRKGTVQRSSTETGVAQPLPAGDMVHAQEVRDSSATRESRGDNTRGAAEPLEVKGAQVGAPTGASEKESAKRDAEIKRSEREAARAPMRSLPGAANIPGREADRENRSGLDAQGQPVAADVAAAAGVEPGKAPVEAKSSASKSSGSASKSSSRSSSRTRQKDPAKVKAGKAAAAKRAAAKQSNDSKEKK